MLAKAKLLPPPNDETLPQKVDTTGETTVQIVAEVVDANDIHGLLISTHCTDGWEGLHVFVPWSVIISIVTHPHFEIERRKVSGFVQAAKK